MSTNEIDHEILPHPVPAAKAIPSWYKNIPSIVEDDNGTKSRQTVKRCVPFLDALTQGYILYLQADIGVQIKENGEFVLYDRDGKNVNPVDFHNKAQIPYTPYDDKYPFSETTMKWLSPWHIKTPPGWSCLFTSPLNHFEPRFKMIDGIVDTDSDPLDINFPFVWTVLEKGEYIIEKGTPMVQVIPFKRETIEMEVTTMTEEELKNQYLQNMKWSLTFKNYYRDTHWHKSSKNKNMPD